MGGVQPILTDITRYFNIIFFHYHKCLCTAFLLSFRFGWPLVLVLYKDDYLQTFKYLSFWLHCFCSYFEGWAPANRFNHSMQLDSCCHSNWPSWVGLQSLYNGSFRWCFYVVTLLFWIFWTESDLFFFFLKKKKTTSKHSICCILRWYDPDIRSSSVAECLCQFMKWTLYNVSNFSTDLLPCFIPLTH